MPATHVHELTPADLITACRTALKSVRQPSMAALFVEYHVEWMRRDFDEHQDGLHEYLATRDLLGDGAGQINFLSWWDCIPKDRPEHSTTNYAVMDFGDGSIAIKRNHNYGDDARWMVAA